MLHSEPHQGPQYVGPNLLLCAHNTNWAVRNSTILFSQQNSLHSLHYDKIAREGIENKSRLDIKSR